MLILLYILLVLSALVWAAVGWAAGAFMLEADGKRTTGAVVVEFLSYTIALALIVLLIWFLMADITITL